MSAIPVGQKCMVVGCESLAKAKGLCKMHYARSRRHDGSTDNTRRQRSVCSVEGCGRPHAAKGLCALHYYRKERTGTTDERGPTEQRTCSVDGCEKPHVAGGLCNMHYMRMQRHGHVIQTRPSDWGNKEKHPLYPVWISMMRYKSSDVCETWHDLWAFVADVESRPSKKYRLERKDSSKPFGPNNVYWREPVSERSEDAKKAMREYMKKWREANPDRAIDNEMKKRYGISLNDYNSMFDEQNGACAICHNEETRVDHWNKMVSRLAVDHDHKTGKVRGLLCHSCNNSLGHMHDDPSRMMQAAIYLASHSVNAAEVITAAIKQLQAALPVSGSA